MCFQYKYYELSNLSNSFEISPKEFCPWPKSKNFDPSIKLLSINKFIFFILDSGVTAASPPSGTPPSAGGGATSSPPAGGGAVSKLPPPNDGAASSPPVVAATVAVPPEIFPYNLSILSNRPVLVITVGVALSS